MRRHGLLVVIAVLAVALLGCQTNDPAAPTVADGSSLSKGGSGRDPGGDTGSGKVPLIFNAKLAGDSEVPPVDTDARGLARFHFEDGMIHYFINVSRIDDIAASHIHMAPAGSNGPIVAFLLGPPGVSGRVNGRLVEGTITDSDLIGPLAGMTTTDLLVELLRGNLYVNVHTTAHPSGEIRGQIGRPKTQNG